MSETARWRELLAADVWPPVALFCFGIWLHAADATLIATILPVAVDEIGGLRIVNWAVALYELGTITAGAVTGLLVARVGVSGVQILGAMAYAAGCALSALAPSMEVLVVGRLFQGLGGGSMIAIAYVGIASLFPSRLTP
ncbi:MAG: MFS transporter, partial [Pseudomonadota bacterium]|nr:MFS transporter [Pseudomonadota bacterium]